MAATFGVSQSSLRFYEQRGLLHPQRCGAARYYSRADILRLRLILKGKTLGFSLEDITRLILAHRRPRSDSVTPVETAPTATPTDRDAAR